MISNNEFNVYNPVKNEILEGIVESVCNGIYRYFLRIRDLNGTLWTTKQLSSISKQIKDLNLKIGDQVKLTFLGKINNCNDYLLEKFEDNRWKSNKSKLFTGEFLEGTVEDVYLGKYNKYVLKIKDSNNKYWITRECKSLNSQIKVLPIKKGTPIQIIFNGQENNEFRMYHYTLKIKDKF